MPFWKYIENSSNDNKILPIIDRHKYKILEALGSGFYSYGTSKIAFYSNAREYLGAILGLVYANPEFLEKWKKDVEFLEKNLIPAFSSLIRKMQKDAKR